ncbi:PLP-dependent aminotransferase family protein [Pararoseomonas sp. SCSIO 73927]|uniref:MocR-like pyridoxine biosynthesis transcription factor PdxR n=1 Tax=Pararoseomonas sp. SCSIO 73927 TaxID=3114537 RepID=UPI0030CE95CF
MSRPSQAFELENEPGTPLFLRIARALIQGIQRGRLRRGARLPGTRALAAQLKVNRNTVVAAYNELALQGWIRVHPSRGATVAEDLPDAIPPSSAVATVTPGHNPGVRAHPAERPPRFVLSDGTPDPRLLPASELARAFRRALPSPAFLEAQGYGDPQGSPKLRRALAELLASTRGLAVGPEDILLTRGSQMGLFLAARAIAGTEPAAIAVEDPGYPLAWEAFRMAGARVVGTPVDREGISVDALRDLAGRERTLRGVLVTPHHQYPTTVTLGAGRRLALLAAAAEHNLTVIEDDYDQDYRFEGRPILPLAASASFSSESPVIYLGSLSKLLAPGLRLGYVVASPDRLRRMTAARQAIDRQGDVPLEIGIAELLQDGELARHARRARKIYLERRDLLVSGLRRELGDALSFHLPAGGLAIWTSVRRDIDAELWASEALHQGLAVSSGVRFALGAEGMQNAFRLGFASLNGAEMENAVRILARSRPR